MAKRSDRQPDHTHIPTDYEDLYVHYFMDAPGKPALAKTLIRRFLPYAQDDEREALLHDTYTRLLEFQILKKFDPAKANFGGAIFFAVRSVCTKWLDQRTRSPLGKLRAGSLTEATDDFEPGLYRLEAIFGTDGIDVEYPARQAVARLMEFAQAALQRGRTTRDKCLLPTLQMLAVGMEPEEIAPRMGVADSTIRNWIAYLRAETRVLVEA